MNKTVFSGSLASVIFLIIGTFAFPGSPVMWLASTSPAYTVFRCVVAVMLTAVLLTNPPRRLAARASMFALAAVMFWLATSLILSNSVRVLDIVMFLELGFAFSIEALEFTTDEIDEQTERLRHPELYVAKIPAWHEVWPAVAAYWQRLKLRHPDTRWQIQ